MSSLLAAAAILAYLAGIALMTCIWPYVIKNHDMARLTVDTNPVAACLMLALVTVAWPAMPLYAALAYFTRRSPR